MLYNIIIMVEYKKLTIKEKKSIAKKLNISKKTFQIALKKEKEIIEKFPYTSPQIAFATALYLSALDREHISQRKMSYALNVSEAGIKNCLKKLK